MIVTNSKLFACLTGGALIALGLVCISAPMSTLASVAWLIGLVALISGIITLLNWLSTRRYFAGNYSLLSSGLLQSIFGLVLMKHDFAAATLVPIFLGAFLLFEGLNVVIRSFAYRKSGFAKWWINLIMGTATALFGLASIITPSIGGSAIGLILGLGFICVGAVYIVASFAISSLSRNLQDMQNPRNSQGSDPWIDEQ